jgi:sec-independent protein translocase protein TatB
MFQGGELIIILIVALVVLGPERLPALAKKAGEYAAELRKAAREIQRGLESEVSGLKEASDELKAVKEEFKKPLRDIQKSVDEVGISRLEWTGPKPISGPTPADAMADLDEIEREEYLRSRGLAGGGEEE